MSPQCPNHQKPMRIGKSGTYFCPTPVFKQGDKTFWCDFKVENLVPSQPSATPQNQPMGLPPESPIKSVQTEDTDRVKGMVRHGLVCALIQKRGLEPITQGDIELLSKWEEYIIEGKVKTFPKSEELSEKELGEIQENIDMGNYDQEAD